MNANKQSFKIKGRKGSGTLIMFHQSWNASLWFLENSPDFYLIIVSLITLIVFGSSLKLAFLMQYRQVKLDFKFSLINKRIIFYGALVLFALLVGLIFFRLEAYWGINPFYTTYTWKLNLFTSAILILMLALWIFKGYTNKMFVSWKTDFLAWKTKHFNPKKDVKQDQKNLAKEKTIINEELFLFAPASGKIKNLSELSDPVFANKTLGDGLAISPSNTTIYAPIDGTIESAFATGHAFGIRHPNNKLAILLHIGIDTIKLKGKGFEKLVTQGQKVKQGDPLVKVDFAFIKKQKLASEVIMVILPESKYQLKLLGKKEIKAKELLAKAKI